MSGDLFIDFTVETKMKNNETKFLIWPTLKQEPQRQHMRRFWSVMALWRMFFFWERDKIINMI